MADSSHLSVQAIRGRFEQFRSDGTNQPNPSPTFCRKGRLPLNSTENRSQNSPLLSPEVALEVSRDSSPSPGKDSRLSTPSPGKDSRVRSYSVGNLQQPSSYKQNEGETVSKKALTRNHSYGLNNYSSENINCNSNAISKPTNQNFNSFSEKQKLVESIVMNIKKSAANAKSKELDQRNKDFRPFSKFEKDLKNVLERGVRRKRNTKEKNLKENNFENQENIKFSKILDYQPKPEQRTIYSKFKTNLGVDLYPINSKLYDETDHKHNQQCQRDYNVGKPPVPTLSNNITKLKQGLISSKQNVESSQYDTCGSCAVPYTTKKSFNYTDNSIPRPTDKSFSYPLEKSCDPTVKLNIESPNYVSENIDKSSPVRPPRRRRKKDKAPMPPSPPDEGNIEPQILKKEKRVDENDCQTLPHEHFNTSDESSYYSYNLEGRRRSAGELSREFNYEERYEKNLEREKSLSNREITDDVFSDICSNSKDIEPFSQSYNRMSQSEIDLNTCKSSPPTGSPGSPPKKPPRTFAYDIYLSLKPENKRDSNALSGSVPKLTSAELDSLYTKPLKRLKDKQTSPANLPATKRIDFRGSKPAVAPKPIDIIAKAKKRLSVTEPLPSNAESKEFSEHKPSVKRNSSFRFSFRKHKKSSGSSPGQTAIKKETQVGRRLRSATKNFQPKKTENEKRVRFQTEDQEEDTVYNFNKDESGPIYATPFSKTDLTQDDQKELHYMCSPLFKNGTEYANETPLVPNSPPNEIRNKSSGTLKNRGPPAPPGNPPPLNDESKERFGIMQELRQSCRLVQKRLKGVTQKDAR